MSNHEDDYDFNEDLAVEEVKPKLKPPKQYKVILNNDDYTLLLHILYQ